VKYKLLLNQSSLKNLQTNIIAMTVLPGPSSSSDSHSMPPPQQMVQLGSDFLPFRPMLPDNKHISLGKNSSKLRRHLNAQGYLYLSELIPRELVQKAQEKIKKEIKR